MSSIACVYESIDDARAAVGRLQKLGVDEDSIGIAMKSSVFEPADLDGESRQQVGEGMLTGALTGAGLGTLVGLALVGSTIVVPGIGPVVLGGPLAAVIAGAGLGLGSGGLIGALVALGINEEEAGWYAECVQSGKIAVFVQLPADAGDPANIRQALESRDADASAKPEQGEA